MQPFSCHSEEAFSVMVIYLLIFVFMVFVFFVLLISRVFISVQISNEPKTICFLCLSQWSCSQWGLLQRHPRNQKKQPVSQFIVSVQWKSAFEHMTQLPEHEGWELTQLTQGTFYRASQNVWKMRFRSANLQPSKMCVHSWLK